jgi:thiamine biosynthesis lipoprotein
MGAFDTIVQVVGYSQSERDFSRMAEQLETRFTRLHRLFDRFEEYDGMANVCTINKMAGVAPVKVDKELIDLLLFCQEWGQKTDDAFNPVFGAVTTIWHNYLMLYGGDSQNAVLPPEDILRQAGTRVDPSGLIVDPGAGTVFLTQEGMSLDLGAVAKGYATELAGQELCAAGFDSFAISSGGNVRVFGAPKDPQKSSWNVGIQNPDKDPADASDSGLDIVRLSGGSVVTSGDYQRYYMVGERRVHHLIDPQTLMPAEYYRSVTVLTEDSGVADLFSTVLFILPYERSREMAELYGINAYWVFVDGSVKYTEGMKAALVSA